MATSKRGASDLVRVACKLPQGLHVPLSSGHVVKLNGASSAYAIANHGMTDLESKVWEQIKAEFPDAKWLTNDFVFAHVKAEDAAAEATDRQKENAGFNPIDPANPNAVPGIGASITRDGVDDNGRN